MYSPLYNILSIEFNVYFAYIFITAIWFVLIYMLFQNIQLTKVVILTSYTAVNIAPDEFLNLSRQCGYSSPHYSFIIVGY